VVECTDRRKLRYWERNIIQSGWYVDEWVGSNGGMILTGENWSTGRKTCQWQIPHGLSELHLPFALCEQGLTSQTLNVKILFPCYIACKDSHIIDKMCLIIICNWRIILKEVLVRVSLGLDFSLSIGTDGGLLWARLWTFEFYCIMWEIYWFCDKLITTLALHCGLIYNLSHFENVLLWQLYWI
jgi:hypothetical protein